MDTSPPKKKTQMPPRETLEGENRAYGITKERTGTQGASELPREPPHLATALAV